MSWYYNYYLCVHDKEKDTIEPLGVYDSKGKLHPVLWKSRSFASDMWEDFYPLNETKLTEKALYDIHGEEYVKNASEDTEMFWKDYTSWLPLSELPTGSYIKRGYFLIEDIETYEVDHDPEVFWRMLSPESYARKLESEIKSIKLEKRISEYKEDDDDDIDNYSCSEYSYYAYPDYTSKEYEAFIIREAAEMVCPYGLQEEYGENTEICVICSQG